MRFCVFKKIIILFFFIQYPLFSILPNLSSIDTPTAFTLPKSSYNISVVSYAEGGIQTKALMGLHQRIFLGISWDINHLIGDQSVEANIPGVSAKLNLFRGWQDFPIFFSIGYDSFFSGRYSRIVVSDENNFNRIIFGPYAVISKPLFILGLEPHLHFGVRTPIQPEYTPQDTSGFIAIEVMLGKLNPIFEVEKIYFDINRYQEVLYNAGFKVFLFDHFTVKINFLLKVDSKADRSIVFEYIDVL